MKYLAIRTKVVFLFLLFFAFQSSNILANEASSNISDLQTRCLEDLDFIRKNLTENSAPYVNDKDKSFKQWFETGYLHTKELIEDIADKDDCHYALKYYLNGFGISHISLRTYIELPKERYPGFLTSIKNNKHVVIYKNPKVTYLEDLEVGDEITHINDMDVEQYYKEYILPFYASDQSEISLESSSLNLMVVNGNKYIPVPYKIHYVKNGEQKTLNLHYTDISDDALKAAIKIQKPSQETKFTVEMMSNTVWIKIPSFFLDRSETIFYTGMLSKLKSLAKEDYIIFDLRGNRGGSASFERPILRNLWGDEFIKTLGKKHVYNLPWKKAVRVSKKNFSEFKRNHKEEEVEKFAIALKKGDKLFTDQWDVFSEDKNLYTNLDNSPIKAKILLLTDNFCRSTCWNFVSEMLQMPNVTHIGATTAIQDPYSYASRARLPSGDFDFFYPTQIRIFPIEKVGSALTPSQIYHGNFYNEAELLNWIFSEVIKQ